MAWSRRLFAVFVVLSLVAFVWFSEVPLFSGTLFDPGRQADKTIELAGTESNVAVLSVVASPSSPPFSPLLPAAAPPSSQPTTPTTEATRKDLPQLTFWLSDLHDGTRADLTSMLTKGLGQRVIMAGSRKKHSELPGATVDPTHKFATYYPEVYRHPLVSFPTRPLPRALSSMKSGEPPVEPDMLELYEYYKDDPDMARVDAFVCTFPMAFCEAYMPFQRPIIWMPAHRYPMGRCSKADRTRLDAHLGAALQRGDKFAAMSMYDAEYLFYYTGIKPIVLTSSSLWYAGLGAIPYAPTRPEILLGPLRSRSQESPDLTAAAAGRYKFVGVKTLYESFTLSQIAQHRALVLLPYAVMSYGITEVYALGVPIFVPSLAFLTSMRIVADRGLMIGNAYCGPRKGYTPNRHPAAKGHKSSPEVDDPKSLAYWLQFADYFQWPHITTFDSWPHLIERLDAANFSAIHAAMEAENKRREESLLRDWGNIIRELGGAELRSKRPPLAKTYAEALAAIPGGFPTLMAPA